jgi:hypothetical protein
MAKQVTKAAPKKVAVPAGKRAPVALDPRVRAGKEIIVNRNTAQANRMFSKASESYNQVTNSLASGERMGKSTRKRLIEEGNRGMRAGRRFENKANKLK